jgi:hypothetical protein
MQMIKPESQMEKARGERREAEDGEEVGGLLE